MLFELEQGDNIDFLLKQARINKVPVPDAIQNAPVLALGLDIYWEGFLELSSCRSIGMGTGPIPWTAIKQYADAYGIEGLEFERFQAIIRGLDSAYLDFHVKKNKRESGK